MGFRTLKPAGLLLAAGLALAMPAAADEWDVATEPDRGIGTDNALASGSHQVHDLAGSVNGGDEDWYLMSSAAFSSHEVVLDGMTSDLDLAAEDVVRLDAAGVATLETSRIDLAAGTRVLGWRVDALSAPVTSFVRVAGAACGTACVDTDRYRIRYRDTTYTIPRFNNAGSQATVLLVQNTTDRVCPVTYHFLDAQGGHLFSTTADAQPAGLQVFPTAGVTSLAGVSGSVRVAHGCGYGGLSGKAVSVEPATGFTFDTSMLPTLH
jgi:hypothetical protein